MKGKKTNKIRISLTDPFLINGKTTYSEAALKRREKAAFYAGLNIEYPYEDRKNLWKVYKKQRDCKHNETRRPSPSIIKCSDCGKTLN